MFEDDDVPSQSQTAAPVEPAPAAPPLAPAVAGVPDMFDGSATDHDVAGDGYMPDASPETTVSGPTALEAGKLVAKKSSEHDDLFAEAPGAGGGASPTLAPPGTIPQLYEKSELHSPSALKKIILVFIILAVVGGVAFAAWVIFGKSKDAASVPASVPAAAKQPAAVVPDPAPLPPDTVDIDASSKPKIVATTTPVVAQPVAQPEPTPEPTPTPVVTDPILDTDKDGLTDVKETALGTDINNPDTDGDGLTDGAEVNIWGTDPLKKDTDGDGFSDGQEVMNGFNPKGPGKLR